VLRKHAAENSRGQRFVHHRVDADGHVGSTAGRLSQPVGLLNQLGQPSGEPDVLSLGGGEEVGVTPANLEERPGLVGPPTSSLVSPSTAVTDCSARVLIMPGPISSHHNRFIWD
jgi:hypothetical protein